MFWMLAPYQGHDLQICFPHPFFSLSLDAASILLMNITLRGRVVASEVSSFRSKQGISFLPFFFFFFLEEDVRVLEFG